MSDTFDEYLENHNEAASTEEKALFQEFDRRFAIARQLLLLRKEAGMTQVQLAEKVEMDQAEISRIERGVGNPTVETLQRIADAFSDVEFGFIRRGHLVEAS
jgi:predicted transcriptional regulator